MINIVSLACIVFNNEKKEKKNMGGIMSEKTVFFIGYCGYLVMFLT